MSEKLVLIDGHSILFRAFYGMPLAMTAPDGLHTNAIYGFLAILGKVMEDEKPDYIAVAFDLPTPTFRHEKYPEYKGNRSPAPAEFHEQVPVMKKLLSDMTIPVLSREGWEADDILGTLADQAGKEGVETALISGDRDLLQIASGRTTIVIPKTKGGQTTYERYTPERVKEEWGVDPDGFIELKALMGDSSDNIPGLPGVGPKTAKKIMTEFGSIENAHEHVSEIKPKKAMEAMRDHYDTLLLSLDLVTIRKDAPVNFDKESMRVGNIYNTNVYEEFKKLGFKSLLGRFDTAETESGGNGVYSVVNEKAAAEKLFREAAESGAAGVSAVEESGKLYAASIVYDGKTYVFLPGKEISEKTLRGLLRTLVTGSADIASMDIKGLLKIAMADDTDTAARPKADTGSDTRKAAESDVTSDTRKALKTDTDSDFRKATESDSDPDAQKVTEVRTPGRRFAPLRTDLGDGNACEIRERRLFDNVIAAYLIDPLKSDWSYDGIAAAYLGKTVPSRVELFGKKGIAAAASSDSFSEKLCALASSEAETACYTVAPLRERLNEMKMLELFETVEMPLTYALASMETDGIYASREELKNYGDSLTGRIEELTEAIYKAAGEEFNINSPKQLGSVLFEKMYIPGGKKTKTGYSTAADVLEKLAPEYPIVADVLEYRKLTKLKSTYADGLPECIGADGKIHTTFNQTITATGRLSSTDPNLQNIPMREELGRLIRKCFYPAEGCVFVDADYSQIELRVLAHMSGDEKLIEAYREAKDIHRITASQVFHTPFDEVTDLQRRNAKAVNFGIVYGISSFGLSQGLSISRKEAADYIKQYFATYPKIKSFLDGLVKSAKKNGYAVSLYGRRRPVPELSSSNFAQRSFGERVAMNSPIQGTAADIMKIAMNRVYTRLNAELPEAKLLLQIHDEVLVEVPEHLAEKAEKIVNEEMTHAAHLHVSLAVDSHIGKNWYEAK